MIEACGGSGSVRSEVAPWDGRSRRRVRRRSSIALPYPIGAQITTTLKDSGVVSLFRTDPCQPFAAGF